jgi:hypothetical protein
MVVLDRPQAFAPPNDAGSPVTFRARYDNFIGGQWVAPANGQYFDNITPVTGQPFCTVARSTAADIEMALDAAHAARGLGPHERNGALQHLAQDRGPHGAEPPDARDR